MGACCGGNYYPEIEESSTIAELSNCLKERRKDFPIEAKEITEYLSDPSKIPKKLNVSGITKDKLKERISFLQKYGQVFEEVSDILDNHQNLNLNEIKPILADLYSYYFLQSDPENKLGSIPQRLRKLVK